MLLDPKDYQAGNDMYLNTAFIEAFTHINGRFVFQMTSGKHHIWFVDKKEKQEELLTILKKELR